MSFTSSNRIILIILLTCLTSMTWAQDEFSVDAPSVILSDIAFDVTITPGVPLFLAQDSLPTKYQVVHDQTGAVLGEGEITLSAIATDPIVLSDLKIEESGSYGLTITMGNASQNVSGHAVPGVLSLLPPLIAIALALLTRQVIIALFCGIWLGVTFLNGYNPIWGFLHTVDTYLVNALADSGHINVLVFSLVLGGMVGVISRAGGTQGIVNKLSQYAKDSRGGQFYTWLMGMVIFFDDYANTLIVGNTMRPLTDKLRISREKLSYLVDSTAAPIATIAFISTWIGYEISLIDQAFSSLGVDRNAYETFIATIPYNFYPIYTMVFGLTIALSMRDFGAMRRAEERAYYTGAVLSDTATPLADMATPEMIADEDAPKRWYNAMIPVAMVILSVAAGLWYTGRESLLSSGTDIEAMSFFEYAGRLVGASDPFAALMWSVFIGSVTAIALALVQRILTLHQALEAWVGGIRSMLMAAIILTAAWAIGDVCIDLDTADYVVHLTKPILSVQWIPLLIFLSAAVIAFATGTSWGTMAILMPIALPLSYKFAEAAALAPDHASAITLSAIAAVLAGATFGDHCSPISDTTIMSSMASGADHIDHVRTQLPYALASGGVACLLGYIPVGFGVSNLILLPLGIIAVVLIIRFFGKTIEEKGSAE